MPINKITHVCLTHDKVRARNEKMLEDAKNGMSQEKLAEKYQICVSTVRYSLKDFYEEQARQRKAKKKAWQTQMIHEYEMGAKFSSSMKSIRQNPKSSMRSLKCSRILLSPSRNTAQFSVRRKTVLLYSLPRTIIGNSLNPCCAGVHTCTSSTRP